MSDVFKSSVGDSLIEKSYLPVNIINSSTASRKSKKYNEIELLETLWLLNKLII